MTVRRVITAGGRSYTVVEDALLDFGAIVSGLAADELTGHPPLDAVRVTAVLRRVAPPASGNSARLAVVAGSGGAFAVAGVARELLPTLAAHPYAIDLTITADGYLPSPLTVAIPAGSALPIGPVTVQLRRPALRLRGRVVTAGAIAAPVNGAQVEVVAPVNVIGLQAAFTFAHPSPTPIVPITLTASAADPDLALTRHVAPGDAALALSRRTNLAPGQIVRLGAGVEREFGIVARLEGPANLDLPGQAVLRAPLYFPHRRDGPPARWVTPGPAPAGPPVLADDVIPGDRVAFVSNAAPYLPGATVRVQDADPIRVEYHVVLLPTDATDANGLYTLGPVGRAASLRVRVTPPAGPAPPDIPYLLDYSRTENVLNVQL